MDIERLERIIRYCLWNGPGGAQISKSNPPPGMKLVSVHFHIVALNEKNCIESRNALIEILSDYPEPDRLKLGPSYIELGAFLGDQLRALMLMAVGEGAGLWRVITPETLHITGAAADEMAGGGMVMISGYEPTSVPATRS